MIDCSIQTHGQRLHSNYLTGTTTNRENSFNVVMPWNVSLKTHNTISKKYTFHPEWHSSILKVTLSRFRQLAFDSNWGIQYKRKIHWARCVREYRNDQHHCMPILPCFHNVSYLFALIARGLSDALYPIPRLFTKQTIHKQRKQSGQCS